LFSCNKTERTFGPIGCYRAAVPLDDSEIGHESSGIDAAGPNSTANLRQTSRHLVVVVHADSFVVLVLVRLSDGCCCFKGDRLDTDKCLDVWQIVLFVVAADVVGQDLGQIGK
jgi:hypothetical protein